MASIWHILHQVNKIKNLKKIDTMKTLKSIFAVVALSLLSVNALAGNGGSTSIRSFVSNIQKSNVLKSSAKSGEVKKVTFTFTVNEKGNVNAVSANLNAGEERQTLETQFSKLNFANLVQGTTYTMDINFINY